MASLFLRYYDYEGVLGAVQILRRAILAPLHIAKKTILLTILQYVPIVIVIVSNSQGKKLGCSVSSTITSSISSTPGIGLGREQLRYLTASLTNTNDYSATEL